VCAVMCVATRETMEMTRRMSDAGADAVLVITPCFYKNAMNNDALYKHYHSVGSTGVTPYRRHTRMQTNNDDIVMIIQSVSQSKLIDIAPAICRELIVWQTPDCMFTFTVWQCQRVNCHSPWG